MSTNAPSRGLELAVAERLRNSRSIDRRSTSSRLAGRQCGLPSLSMSDGPHALVEIMPLGDPRDDAELGPHRVLEVERGPAAHLLEGDRRGSSAISRASSQRSCGEFGTGARLLVEAAQNRRKTVAREGIGRSVGRCGVRGAPAGSVAARSSASSTGLAVRERPAGAAAITSERTAWVASPRASASAVRTRSPVRAR